MKRSRINPISKKKQMEKGIEAELRAKLLECCGGKCQDCGEYPTKFPFVLDKHEKVFRSHGGDPTDYTNCIMLCRSCHNRRHGIRNAGDI